MSISVIISIKTWGMRGVRALYSWSRDRQSAVFHVFGSYWNGRRTVSRGLLVTDGKFWVKGNLPWIDLGIRPSEYLSAELMNNTAALRYALTDALTIALFYPEKAADSSFFVPETTLWLAEELRIPISLSIRHAAVEGWSSAVLFMDLNITNVNSADNVITAPASASAHPAQSAWTPKGEETDSSWTDVFDSILQGLTGGFSATAVYDSVEITNEATDSLMAKKEQIAEYREAYPDDPLAGPVFRDLNTEDSEYGNWLHDWFWNLFD